MSRLLLVAAWLLVVWGALAFGAVYPWAWRPLITGCAVVGAASWLVGWRHRARAHDTALLAALGCVALGALVQLAPMPRSTRLLLSPSTETLLLDQDLEYASAAHLVGVADDGSMAQVPAALPERSLSINPDATARGLVMLVSLTLLLAGLTRLLSITGARRLVTALVVFGAALALFGIIQRAVLGDDVWGGMLIYGFWKPINPLTSPFGPFVNKNHFAGWMLMGLPLAMGLGLGWAERAQKRGGNGWRDALLWLSSPDGGKLQLAALAAMVMAVSLLMTKSRSGIAAFVLSMLLAGSVVGKRVSGGGSRGGSRWLALGALAVMLVGVFAWAGAGVTDRFTSGSVGLRRVIWRDSAHAVRDFPLVGTGLNTFSTAMLTYQTTQRDTHFQEAHNDYLQILVEGGLLLGLPAAFALVMLPRAIRRRFATNQDEAMAYWLRVGATTGLTAIGLQSLVEFSLQMPGNAVFCVVLMAIAMHEAPSRWSSRRRLGAPDISSTPRTT
jgi:O-antigen ligase